MSKRTSKEVRKAILQVLKDGKPHSLGDLERKTGTNWLTIRSHTEDLEILGMVTKKAYAKHDRNGRPYIEITITEQGLRFLKKIN